MKTFLNVLGAIVAAVLSIVLIAVLVATPIWQGFSGLLKEDALEKIITRIDFSEIVSSSPELMAELTSEGISPEATEAILNSNTFDELMQLFFGDALHAMKGEFSTTSLSEDALREIVERNIAEVLSIIRLMVPESTSLSDEQLENAVYSVLPVITPSLIVDVNDALEDLQNEMSQEGVTQAVVIAASPIITLALLGVILVLAILIFLCRLRGGEGLLWLGIDSILSSMPVLAVGMVLKNNGILTSAITQVPDGEILTVLFPMLNTIGTTILISGAVLLGVGILLIIGFVLVRKHRAKKLRAVAVSALGEVM